MSAGPATTELTEKARAKMRDAGGGRLTTKAAGASALDAGMEVDELMLALIPF